MTHAMQTLRTVQVENLVQTRGAHYNVFKNKPGMLALFDACKQLEEDVKSFVSVDSTDESND